MLNRYFVMTQSRVKPTMKPDNRLVKNIGAKVHTAMTAKGSFASGYWKKAGNLSQNGVAVFAAPRNCSDWLHRGQLLRRVFSFDPGRQGLQKSFWH